MTRLVQLQNGTQRRVALVEEPRLRLLNRFSSVFEMADACCSSGQKLGALVKAHVSDETLDYDSVYDGKSPWRLLVPIDHPVDASRCMISGTGLTHLGSAKNRDDMHVKSDAELTESMRMFRLGLEAGRPAPGKIGCDPEWFYKGNGNILRAPGEPLDVPPYALDGGEEAEIVGIFLIDAAGNPHRIGMALGNEFSDHKFEKLNYLNLAGSKNRTCSIGPELMIDPEFQSIPGTVTIERAGKIFWSKEILTGEAEMCHSLANIEHHHFKFETHRRPRDLHVHFYGACALSFGAGIELKDGDVMSVQFAGFGRALRNPVRISKGSNSLVVVQSLA